MHKVNDAMVVQLRNVTTPQVFRVAGMPIPATLWVRPNSNTLTVEYSTDNGDTFQVINSLNGATSYRDVIVQGGFTHLRITCSNTNGGTWGYV